MKIVDCFSFFNELELLEIRLNILDPYVDTFVLVEAAKTQTLKDKPFVFEKNKSRYEQFLDRIVYVKLEKEMCPEGEFENYSHDWTMENLQRDSAKIGIGKLDLELDDIVLISDLDEIPNLTEIDRNVDAIRSNMVTSFVQNTYSYYVNMQCYDANDDTKKISRHSLGVTRAALGVHSPQDLWAVRNTCPAHETTRGWHLSWLGGPQKVREKSMSCIEPFDKSCVPSEDEIETLFRKRVMEEGFWNINDPNDNAVKVHKIENEESVLPEYLIKNKNQYKHLFC